MAHLTVKETSISQSNNSYSLYPLGLFVSGEDKSCGEGLPQVGQQSPLFFLLSSGDADAPLVKDVPKKFGYPGLKEGAIPGKNPEYVGTARRPRALGAEEYGLLKDNPPAPIAIVEAGADGKKLWGLENPVIGGAGSPRLFDCRGLGKRGRGEALGLTVSEEVSLAVLSESGSLVLSRSSMAWRTSPPFLWRTTFRMLLFSLGNTRAKMSTGDFFL